MQYINLLNLLVGYMLFIEFIFFAVGIYAVLHNFLHLEKVIWAKVINKISLKDKPILKVKLQLYTER